MASQSKPQITCSYFNHHHGQIHYRHIPSITPSSSKPPILLLHKSASSSASCIPLMRYYSALGHPCYAPDMPGFGNSFDPSNVLINSQDRGMLTTKWYVSLYVDMFGAKGLGLEVPFHVMGHHSGAALAMEMAADYPEIVKSVVLIGASIMTASERGLMKAKFFSPFNEPIIDGSHLPKTWQYLLKMGPFSTFTNGHSTTLSSAMTQTERLEILQREALDHVRAWKGRNQIYGAVWDQDAMGVYRNITRPVMVICAKDDVLWEFFHHVREVRPEVRAEALEVGGGNFSLDFCWREIGGLVDSFWKDEGI